MDIYDIYFPLASVSRTTDWNKITCVNLRCPVKDIKKNNIIDICLYVNISLFQL